MQKREQLGGLTCRIVQQVDDDEQPELVVILCHGFGAPGTDLVPIGGELMRCQPRLMESTQFIFPQAPLSLEEFGMIGGRAWWPLDVVKLNAAIQRGEFRDQRKYNPPELANARQMLMALIDEVRGRTGLPASKIVLGGFSQGSMLATDVALRMDQAPGALCVWSGTLLCEEEWRELALKRGSLKVLQSHGTVDPILPFEAATWLRDLFVNSGFNVEFIEFPDVHTIPRKGIEQFAELLVALLDE
ncbi:MAG: phospholipase [Planctomycetota bacterium]|nr:phospholipase [Planctomycetota bacterium]